MTSSPAETTSVSELFDREPSLLKESELDLIIGELRKSRHRWAAGDKQAGAKKKAAPKLTKAETEVSSLNLGTVDLSSLLNKKG